MNWWGKLLGGAFGFALGGPLGALLGAVLGHQFDKGLKALKVQMGLGDVERVQAAFFTATFAVMGRLAKADGRVSAHEIGFAETVMGHMALGPDQRKAAIELFRRGKDEDFDLEAVLDQLRSVSHYRHNLLRMFLEIQLQAAYADGALDGAEREFLLHVFERLGFSAAEFAHLDAMVRAARHFAGAGGGGGAGAGAGWREAAPRRDLLAEAYRVLDVAPEAADAEVKKAYRRLMNQHHPDKLVARGLPEEMMKLATENAQEIKAAYETVKQARGMR